ncbi:MAG TPA: hypothetical protein VJN18_14450 [Polyangiaceae bacterium]|nr:hypothetical protein [Polyangiaceae bacterium]
MQLDTIENHLRRLSNNALTLAAELRAEHEKETRDAATRPAHITKLRVAIREDFLALSEQLGDG